MSPRLFLSTLGAFVLAAASSAQIQISELMINPQGDDGPNEYFELRGAAGASLNDYFFLSVEGDIGSNAGLITQSFDLSAFSLGNNGTLFGRQTGNTSYAPAVGTTSAFVLPSSFGGVLQNGSNSFLLVRNTTATAATFAGFDVDSGNNGTLTLPAGTTLIDGIGVLDGGSGDRGYGTVVFPTVASNRAAEAVQRLTGDGIVGGGVIQTPGSLNLDTTAFLAYSSAYRGVHLDGTSRDADFETYAQSGFAGAGDPNRQLVSVLTPGAINPVPEPATMAAMALGLSAFVARRRKR